MSYVPRKSGVLVPKGWRNEYEAARPSRKRRWLPTITRDSRDVLTPYVLRTLRSSARRVFENSGFVRGAILDVARYLIGYDGIRPQWMSADDGWNREVELRWLNWLKICDYRRRLHGNQIFRAASVEMDVDGDFGIILTQTGGGDSEEPGMAQIQTVRAHRIDDPPNTPSSRAGVAEGKSGRIAGYYVIHGDGDKPRFVPAQSMILLGDPELSDWTRYPSAIAHGLNILQDGKEVMEHVRDGIKARTARAFWHETATGEPNDDVMAEVQNADVQNTANAVVYEELLGGTIPLMEPGEKLHELSANYPGDIFQTLEFDRRDFACGYGVPLEAVWKGDLGGPAQRFYLSKFQRRVDERRSMVFIPHLLNRLAGYWISMEMNRGAISRRPDWWQMRWVATSPKVTIDVGREAQQNREDILLGNRTLQKDIGESGEDWEEVREQTEREARDLITRADRIAKEFNMTRAEAMALLSQRVTGSQYLNLTELMVPKQKPSTAPTEPLSN